MAESWVHAQDDPADELAQLHFFSFKKRQPEGNINVGAQGDTAIAPDLQYRPVDLSFAGLGLIPAWNVPGAVGRYMTFAPTETASYLIPKAWQVKEKTTTAFLKGNLDATTFGVPMRASVCRICRCRLLRSTTSSSAMRNVPMPAAAR